MGYGGATVWELVTFFEPTEVMAVAVLEVPLLWEVTGEVDAVVLFDGVDVVLFVVCEFVVADVVDMADVADVGVDVADVGVDVAEVIVVLICALHKFKKLSEHPRFCVIKLQPTEQAESVHSWSE